MKLIMVKKSTDKTEVERRKATLAAVLKLPLKPLPGRKNTDATAILRELRYGKQR